MKKLSVIIFLLCFGIGFWYTYHTYSPIPKIIHYVWLGKHPLPESAQKMIASWQKNAPDYKIMRWDETNCDVDANHYIKWAYKSKLWAFASDWCRLQALHKYGGLYLDTDHELIQNPSRLFRQTELVLTYQSRDFLSGSFIATSKGNPFIKSLITYYENLGLSTHPIPHHLTDMYYAHFDRPLDGKMHLNRDVSLIPTNIAMIDFGGGENVAIHHYDGTDADNKNGEYHKYFSKLFLQEMSIPVCINNEKYKLILSDEKRGYFYDTDKMVQIIHQTQTDLTIKIEGKIYPLYFKNGCFFE